MTARGHFTLVIITQVLWSSVGCGGKAQSDVIPMSTQDASPPVDASLSYDADASSDGDSARDAAGGSDGGGAAEADASGETDVGHDAEVVVEAGSCPPGLAINSFGDIPAFSTQSWVTECTSYYGAEVTLDLLAVSDLTLDAYQVPLPASCWGCADKIGFAIKTPIDGISSDTPTWPVGDRYLKVKAGSVFRLRPVLQCNHPSFPDKIPALLVLPPCSTQCAVGATRCATDLVCYPAGEPSCRSCEGKDAPTCACVSPTGPLPEGAVCTYPLTDVLMYGTCQQGLCVISQ
jgi:hypothetical protein